MTGGDHPTPLEAALRYASLGLRVVPIIHGQKRPRPTAWQDVATTDPARIQGWFKAHPGDGVGIATGPGSGIWCLDVDVAEGKQGKQTLGALVAEHGGGKLPETWVAKSARGGWHYVFAYPTDGPVIGNGRVGPPVDGLDFKGEGGQFVASPTIWGSGQYQWIPGRAPGEIEVKPAPEWLLEHVAEKPAPTPSKAVIDEARRDQAGDRPDYVEEYERRTSWPELLEGWTHAYTDREGVEGWVRPGKDRRQGISATVNFGGLDRLYVFTTSIPWLPIPPKGRMFSRIQFVTFRDYGGDFEASGRALGTQPRAKASAPPKVDTATGEIFDDEDTALVMADGYRLTDAGNASRLIDKAGGRIRYVHEWGRWIAYYAGRWIVDGGDVLVTEEAKNVSRAILAMVPKASADDAKRLVAAAIKAESSGGVSGMIRLARGVSGVIVAHEQLDADPYLLNCLNGTVDLRTGELRPHDPADLCTLQCPVRFDPDALAPLWAKCLDRWQPDLEVQEYLQREAGASACGLHTETLSIHYGGGANGKSKYFGAQQHALGPYAVVPHKSLLVASRNEQHDTVKAALFRARLAVAGETSDSASISEDQAKNLTGGDPIMARRMREDPWEFMPSHTLVMFSNHLPTITGTDEGIWRRVRMIPWNVTIPEGERDLTLPERLRAEAPGILRWMVEGARRFLADGLTPPVSVRVATEGYRTEEDTAARFMADVGLIFDPGSEVVSSTLTELHLQWCLDNSVEKLPPHWALVTAKFKRNGCKAERGNRGRFWTGIRLQEGRP
jgi:putative DNA primase/helicase